MGFTIGLCIAVICVLMIAMLHRMWTMEQRISDLEAAQGLRDE
jgi:hypothetical protein